MSIAYIMFRHSIHFNTSYSVRPLRCSFSLVGNARALNRETSDRYRLSRFFIEPLLSRGVCKGKRLYVNEEDFSSDSLGILVYDVR